MVTKCATLTKVHIDFIQESAIDFSGFVRKKLEEEMRERKWKKI